MPDPQRFFYFMSDDPEPVHGGSALWDTVLPLDRYQYPYPEMPPVCENLTYGEYFEAVSTFIDTHLSDFIPKALFHVAERVVDPHEISRIHVHIEKHGAFYHPAKVVLLLSDCRISLVVNVAFSVLGKQTIKNECRQLKRLANRAFPAWVPHVFGSGKVRIDKQRNVQMFLGEWFEGFHEFHVSDRSGSGARGIRVWDPENGNLFLSRQQTRHVFEQAALILTAHYNIETFEQIDAWHHAAGDFVVCMNEVEPMVKLITVRQYKPLFSLVEKNDTLETTLNTLLIFFLNMSMRLRIDRMDGVGNMTWIEVDVVSGIISGFFKGLVLQAENSRIPHELIHAFQVFILHLSEMDIRDIFMELLQQIDPRNQDQPVIRQNLDDHIEAVFSGLHQVGLPL